jgi:hypothetical protein
MALFTTLGIGGRIWLASGFSFLSLVLIGGISLHQTARLDHAAIDLSDNRLPSVLTLSRIQDATLRFRETQAAGILASDPASAASIARSRAAALADVADGWKAYQGEIDPGMEKERLAPAIDAAWKNYLAQDTKFEALLRAGNKDAAALFYTAGSAGDLARRAGELRDEVGRYIAGVKAA